ncbi:hypothetical protein IE4771_CH01052 [Rhizobium etli bv. mimosae str. IE4771]|uniref:Uncharacterized protein n=1 Tax=Rhizobium etli bv. mimosae str. IE4771 TaxID=1432050 RepID=A0A060I2S5_RHIET|nr:hypothetical protein IE4771_CH01052 [Rhizobium sp. IE4771]
MKLLDRNLRAKIENKMNLLARLLRASHYLAAVQPSPGITEEGSGRSGCDEPTAGAKEHAASPVRLATKPLHSPSSQGLTLGSTAEHVASTVSQRETPLLFTRCQSHGSQGQALGWRRRGGAWWRRRGGARLTAEVVLARRRREDPSGRGRVVPGDTSRARRDQPSAAEKAASAVRLAAKPTTLSVIPGLDPGIHDQALGFYFSTVGLLTHPA